MSWSAFLRAHWGAIAATDFFTVEVVTLTGLVRYYVLFVIDLKSRRVEIAGTVRQPFDSAERPWATADSLMRSFDNCRGGGAMRVCSILGCEVRAAYSGAQAL